MLPNLKGNVIPGNESPDIEGVVHLTVPAIHDTPTE